MCLATVRATDILTFLTGSLDIAIKSCKNYSSKVPSYKFIRFPHIFTNLDINVNLYVCLDMNLLLWAKAFMLSMTHCLYIGLDSPGWFITSMMPYICLAACFLTVATLSLHNLTDMGRIMWNTEEILNILDKEYNYLATYSRILHFF